jgi:hypothetical protein
MSPNFPKIKFILRINSHCVNVLTACSSVANEFASVFFTYIDGVRVVQFAKLHVFTFSIQFLGKNDVWFIFPPNTIFISDGVSAV